MIEEWRSVVGYEGLYMVSNLGRVMTLGRLASCGKGNYNRPSKIMKPTVCKTGKTISLHDSFYLRLKLMTKDHREKKHFVHRLVAEAFLPNPNGYDQINHKDGNKFNNSVFNLEWCNMSQNQLHRVRELGIMGRWKERE